MDKPVNELTSLETARAKKVAKCPFCAKPKHEAEYGCPRIRSVIFHNDDPEAEGWSRIEVTFWDDDDYDLAG